MQRKIKNAIMIILIIALLVSMYFTINYQKSKIQAPNMAINDFQNRPENRSEMIEAPTKPEGEEANNNMTEPPEMSGELVQGNSSNPPAKHEGENSELFLNNKENMRGQNGQRNFSENVGRNNTVINILLGAEILTLFLILVYLIMSKFNITTFKETFNKPSKIIIYLVLVIILTAGTTLFTMYLNKNNLKIDNKMIPNAEEEVEKETTAENVDSGETVSEENIDLSKYSSNITINKAGNYTLTGEFNYSVLVNADAEVRLNLDNVTIKNDITSAIANISTNSLILNLVENTTNTLSDGGSSEYDGCIYSTGPLTIEGNGNLNVYGNQEEGEGIATTTNDITINGGNIKIECNDDGINAGGDGGTITINAGTIYIKASGDGIDSNKDIVINGGNVYSMGSSIGGDAGIDADEGITINGGSVIALGSDMLEKPLATSKQDSLCFNLDSAIENGSTIILKDKNNKEITTFEADENFKTLIISNEKLEKGTYYLYKDGEKISEIEN